MLNNPRYYKEICAAIYFSITVFEDKEITEWQRWQLNRSLGLDQSTSYSFLVEGFNMVVWNDQVKIEYVHHEESDKRMVSVKMTAVEHT